ELLLGDEFVCEVIDRVGLTNVRIEPATNAPSGGAAKAGTAGPIETEYEEPVDLVRSVLAEGDFEVEYTVNGWPAAFWKSFGEGKLLVTTLGPRGWMRRRTAADARSIPDTGEFQSTFAPLSPMGTLAH